MIRTGEKPGKGVYICTNCGTKVTLEQDGETMPPCPKCHNTTFERE